MKRQSQYIRILLCLMAAAFWNSANAEPTIQETKDFISDKAKSCGEFEYQIQETGDMSHLTHVYGNVTRKITFENDALIVYEGGKKTIHNTSKDIIAMNLDREYISRASLSDLDPQIEIRDDDKIVVRCAGANCFTGQERTKYLSNDQFADNSDATWGDWTEDESSTQNYRFCNADTAQRIQKALSYLISQSGGKKQLF